MSGFMQNSETGDIEMHIGDNTYDECVITVSKEVAIQIRDFLNGINLPAMESPTTPPRHVGKDDDLGKVIVEEAK